MFHKEKFSTAAQTLWLFGIQMTSFSSRSIIPMNMEFLEMSLLFSQCKIHVSYSKEAMPLF